MKMQSTMPTEGQFVAVWEYNDVLWSAVYKWDGDVLLSYCLDQGSEDYDEFVNVIEGSGPSEFTLKKLRATYIVG